MKEYGSRSVTMPTKPNDVIDLAYRVAEAILTVDSLRVDAPSKVEDSIGVVLVKITYLLGFHPLHHNAERAGAF